MNRLRNFVHGVFSGYVQMAANIVFTLASVPLALHYLSKQEFALWALVTQVVGYFALIDLGMTTSVSRILADHKDDRDGGRYGGVLKAGALVFTAQGALIALATFVFSGALAAAFRIDAEWRPMFIFLLRGHGLILAFTFATKIFGAPVWGFQRYDITNYCSTAGFALQLAALWLGFSAGWGVKSMLAGYAVTAALNAVWPLVAGIWLRFYPRQGAWGRLDHAVLREMFTFGRDIFLMTLGGQMLSASQIMIISRFLGLDAAATWAICSKIFILAQQVVARLFDTSVGGFTEMYVRGESGHLRRRFSQVVAMTASASVLVGSTCAAINGPFVRAWTHGRVSWAGFNDVLLGILIFVYCVSRCHTGMAGVNKHLRALRFIYFFEGVTFVAVAWFTVRWMGITAAPLASIVAMLCWSWSYGSYFSRATWDISASEQWRLLLPAFYLLLILAPLWGCLSYATATLATLPRLIILGGLGNGLSLAAFWKAGVSRAAREEILKRVGGTGSFFSRMRRS